MSPEHFLALLLPMPQAPSDGHIWAGVIPVTSLSVGLHKLDLPKGVVALLPEELRLLKQTERRKQSQLEAEGSQRLCDGANPPDTHLRRPQPRMKAWHHMRYKHTMGRPPVLDSSSTCGRTLEASPCQGLISKVVALGSARELGSLEQLKQWGLCTQCCTPGLSHVTTCCLVLAIGRKLRPSNV